MGMPRLDSIMRPRRVLIIGGYGFFGRRLAQQLSRRGELSVIVAGRSAGSGQALVEALRAGAQAELHSAVLDLHDPAFSEALGRLLPDIVVHASGPFQGQDYRVAQACITCGAHYIDLADGRQFVADIGALDSAARAAGVVVVSGASSVPALSSAAADHLAGGFVEIQDIDIGISPGNRTERGLSTLQAILTYCGKPLPSTGMATPVIGWLGSRSHAYPEPVGMRLLSPCDVPDLTLLPGRYAGAPAVRFGAGLELRFLHRGMNALAALTRMGLVSNWSAHAATLKRVGDWFKALGSDAGAMHVSLAGLTAEGTSRTRTWHLVATAGDGPYVPTLAAAALVRKLCSSHPLPAGARPCIGLLSLDDFLREFEGLHIRTTEAAA
jgi:hypothetical protein